MKITKLIKIFRNCEMALKQTQLELKIMRIRTEMVVEKKNQKISEIHQEIQQ